MKIVAAEAQDCGVTDEGYVRCWGSDSNGRATPTLNFADAETLGATDEAEASAEAAEAEPEPPRAASGRMAVPKTAKERLAGGDLDSLPTD